MFRFTFLVEILNLIYFLRTLLSCESRFWSVEYLKNQKKWPKFIATLG